MLQIFALTAASCAGSTDSNASRFEEEVRRALHGKCEYALEASISSPVTAISYPERASPGARVRVLGFFGEETEQFMSSSTCESPHEVGGAYYGSRLAAPLNGDHHGYWMWIRCPQMVSLAPCQGKYVEAVATYERSDSTEAGGVASDRLVNVTSVHEVPMPADVRGDRQ